MWKNILASTPKILGDLGSNHNIWETKRTMGVL